MSDSLDTARAQQALRRGVDRLVGLAGPTGWHGFRTLAGDSDVWVSAFVIARIGPEASRRSAVRRARVALAAAQDPAGGWSFGGDVPPDADSTAWTLLALEGTRLADAAVRERAGAFLSELSAGDGYSTYGLDGRIGVFVEAGARSLEGWTSEHPDVTAAVLAAGPPGASSAERLIRLAALVERQTGAGWWPAYWWRTPLYTTALVLRALHRHGRSLPADREQRLLNALVREQLPGGGYPLGGSPDADPFVTALALETLTHLVGDQAREAEQGAGAALVNAQLADGGWMGDFQLRIPPPDVRDPDLVRGWARGGGGGASYVLDRDGIFATAQACTALSSWLAGDQEAGRRPEVPRRPPREEDVMEALASLPLGPA